MVRTLRLSGLALTGLLGTLAFPMAFPWAGRQEWLASGALEPLAFVCLVPALLAVRGLSARRAALAGFGAGMVFFVGTIWWVNIALTVFGGLPNALGIPVMLLLCAYGALHWALVFFVVRALELREGWSAGWTVGPVWMAVELLRNYSLSGFPWSNLGYSQARTLWVAQLASVGGVYLIALLVAGVNGALYEALRALLFKDRPLPKRLLMGWGAALVAVLAYGALRVHRWEGAIASAESLKVAVVQGNIDQKLKNMQGSHRAMVLDAYNPPTSAADASGAELIVWPEAAFPGRIERSIPAMSTRYGLAKDSYGAHLLLGVDLYSREGGQEGFQNAAFLLDPNLNVRARYAKYHLVPFGEYVPLDLHKLLPIENVVPGTFLPGHELNAAELTLPPKVEGGLPRRVRVGILICFDAIFPELARSYAKDGVELLVNLTNDAWYGFSSAPFQFLRIVALRAVETGRPVARAANTGISGFIDPLGRIHDTTALGLVDGDGLVDARLKAPPEWRLASLPMLTQVTPYAVMGDLFAYAAALAAALAVAWSYKGKALWAASALANRAQPSE
jgi:apolipoprotein N-acyltransferase